MKRGRNQRRRQGGQNPNRALDSNGPDVRIRGTAMQIYDKYQALARDASSAGDRVKAENCLQHAEHYFRLIKSMQPAQPQASANADAQDGAPNGRQAGNGAGNGASADAPGEAIAEASSAESSGADIIEDQPSSDDSAVTGKAAKDETIEGAAGEAAAGESEGGRKPRRRRPRRTVKKDDAADGASAEEAVAS
ncbi:MAG: DUF4167 domain-containing protein [Pseudomonadota bacterium]